MAIFTFKKKERLKSRKIIGRLFKEGQSFGVYPLRLAFLQIEKVESEMPVQFTVSVPEKKFQVSSGAQPDQAESTGGLAIAKALAL